MAMALRPQLRPSSMNSRNGSQADGAGWGFSGPTLLNPTPNPVVTCMAGFESGLLLFLLLGRFSGLMSQFSAASPGSDPVVTCMAGFESGLLLFLLLGRFSGLMSQFSAASPGSDPVVTSLAGFAGTCRPQAPGARTAMPAAL